LNGRFCDVAFPVPVHRQFTYEIPAPLFDAAVVGARVIAPFRKRHLTGVITSLSRESTLDRVKPIDDVLESGPTFSDEMMKLTKWISDYYLSSWGEALKTAGPTGTSIESSQHVRLLDLKRE